MLERDALGGERVDQREHPCRRFAIRGELGDLRADVHVDAAHDDRRHLRRAPVQRVRVVERDAELALLESGRDVRMRQRIDVRIHAKADRRALAHARRRPPPRCSSSLADSTLKHRMPAASAASISASLLPTPEKTTLRGSPPAAIDARELAAGDDVEAAAEPREQVEDRERRIRLHRVADEVRNAGERRVERPVRARQQSRANTRSTACRSAARSRTAARLRREARRRRMRKPLTACVRSRTTAAAARATSSPAVSPDCRSAAAVASPTAFGARPQRPLDAACGDAGEHREQQRGAPAHPGNGIDVTSWRLPFARDGCRATGPSNPSMATWTNPHSSPPPTRRSTRSGSRSTRRSRRATPISTGA